MELWFHAMGHNKKAEKESKDVGKLLKVRLICACKHICTHVHAHNVKTLHVP